MCILLEKSMSVYDPNRSSAGTDTIVDWCRQDNVSASDDITTVPGVGPSFKEVLEDNEIFTVAQMIGIFLMEVDGERDAQEVCQAFYDAMKAIVAGTRAKGVNMHAVTFAIANFVAEKGLFDYDINDEQ